MDAQKVDMFIMANGKYFAEEKISFIRTGCSSWTTPSGRKSAACNSRAPRSPSSCPSSWDVTALTASISVISAWE